MEQKFGFTNAVTLQYKRLGIIGKKKGNDAKAAEEKFNQKLSELMPNEWVVKYFPLTQ